MGATLAYLPLFKIPTSCNCISSAFKWEFTAQICLTSFLAFFFSCPVPLVAPANISGYNTSSTSIHVAWQPISPDDTNIRGLHRGYRVYYTPINTNRPSVQMNATVDAHITYAELNDLYKYTNYSIYVVVMTRWEGVKSPMIHLFTDEGSRSFVFILGKQIQCAKDTVYFQLPYSFWQTISLAGSRRRRAIKLTCTDFSCRTKLIIHPKNSKS